MLRVSSIVFTENERKVLEIVAPTLHVAFDKSDEDEARIFSAWNGLSERAPIPAKRLKGSLHVAKVLASVLKEQTQNEYWRQKAKTPEDLGDPDVPTSAAHMINVFIESREQQLAPVERAISLLESAVLWSDGEEDLGERV